MVTIAGLVSMVTVVPWQWDGELLLMAGGTRLSWDKWAAGQWGMIGDSSRLGTSGHGLHLEDSLSLLPASECRASPPGSLRPAISLQAQRLESSPINHLAPNTSLCVTLCCAVAGAVSHHRAGGNVSGRAGKLRGKTTSKRCRQVLHLGSAHAVQTCTCSTCSSPDP